MDAEDRKSPVLISFRANPALTRGIDRTASHDYCSRADAVRRLVAEGLRQKGLLEERPA
jgi:hypothetical protein